MPTLYFHYKFGHNVLDNLSNEQKQSINSNIKYFDMFNQGFDNLYYYPYKWNYYRKFGVRCHKKNLDIFFTNLITYIKENNLQNDSSVTNMLYGFINHLTLDTIMHPYINYQVENLNIPHAKIEFLIDFYIYENLYHTKWQNKLYKALIPRLKFTDNLLNTIDDVFINAYNKENIGKIMNKSHNTGYYIYRYFITDIHGIKTFFYRLADIIFRNKDFKFSKTTFYNKGFRKELLNREKNNWHHPRDDKEIYNYSLKELHDMAYKIALKLNKLAYQVINDKKDIQEFINIIQLLDIKNIQELL